VEFIYQAILVLHFIGLASVVGGFLVQMKSTEKGVNPAMLHGAITQLVTGLLLVGIPEMELAKPYDDWVSWDHGKIAVKLVLTLIITVLAIIGRRRSGAQVGLWAAIGGLSIVNIVIAVFWN
jgi:NO-binding membrane sensor protein with MHYT domain